MTRLLGLLCAGLLVASPGCSESDDGGGETSTGVGTTSGAGTTTGAGTTGDTTAGTTEGGGTTGAGSETTGGPPSTCDLACQVFFECDTAYESVADCVPGCEAQFGPGEQAELPPCRDSTETWLLCISGLTCEEYAVWLEEQGGNAEYPCKAESEAVTEDC